MSKLVIKKRVSLEFLGDEYKDAYIDFKSIPVPDYPQLLEEINKSKQPNSTILDILKTYYVNGKFPNAEGNLEDLDSKDELDALDKDTLLECFGKITGQDLRGMVETKEKMAAEGASQEEIDGVAIDVNPKSEEPSKLG